MGRTTFTANEIEQIKVLLRDIRRADRSRQKTLRAKLRREFDFYITDFATDQAGFTASAVDDLVQRGVIAVTDDPADSGASSRLLGKAEGSRSHAGMAETNSFVPSLPAGFKRRDLEAVGFAGWLSWAELRASRFAAIPATPAVYLVYRPSSADPKFFDVSPGGRLKGRNPTVPLDTLHAEWVAGAHTIYIGKADDARARLRLFARFGEGKPVGHWGGRYIWQIADSGDLLVAWHAITWDEVAREYEVRLLARFAELHGGRRPFANLTG